jgi:hypothetical protein
MSLHRHPHVRTSPISGRYLSRRYLDNFAIHISYGILHVASGYDTMLLTCNPNYTCYENVRLRHGHAIFRTPLVVCWDSPEGLTLYLEPFGGAIVAFVATREQSPQ